MELTTEVVNIEDVFPLEDEYGNSMARRDYSLKANRDYVKRLAESFDPETHLPDEPPVLVRDGGLYRITTGNSRVEAMRLLKVKSFPAVVVEGDAKEVVEAAWRTDTKKTYEAEERADIFKALTLFGDDEYVSKVTGVESERVKRIRKGAARAGEAMDQMTMEWMEAVGEFEDDPEAAKAILEAGAREWQWKASSLRAKRERDELRAKMEEALSAKGVEIAEDGADMSGMTYAAYLTSLSDTEREFDEGSVAVFRKDSSAAYLYIPSGARETDPEEEARKARKDEAAAQFEEARASRGKWLAEHLAEIDPADISKALPSGTEVDAYDWEVNSFCEAFGVELPIGPAVTVAAYCELDIAPWPKYGEEPRRDSCRDFVALTDAMELCGYEPPEAEQKLYQMAKDYLEEGTDE